MNSRHAIISLFMNTDSTWVAAGWTGWWAVTLSSCKATYSSRNWDSSQIISLAHSMNSRENQFLPHRAFQTKQMEGKGLSEKMLVRHREAPSPFQYQHTMEKPDAAVMRLLCQAVCLRKALPRPHVLFAAAMAACKINT